MGGNELRSPPPVIQVKLMLGEVYHVPAAVDGCNMADLPVRLVEDFHSSTWDKSCKPAAGTCRPAEHCKCQWQSGSSVAWPGNAWGGCGAKTFVTSTPRASKPWRSSVRWMISCTGKVRVQSLDAIQALPIQALQPEASCSQSLATAVL
jgi:hypothetical protein